MPTGVALGTPPWTNDMIRGTKIDLREPRDEDESTISSIRNDIGIQLLLLTHPRPNSLSRVRSWLASVAEDPDSVFFVVADTDTQEAVGFIQVRQMNILDGHGRLGIAIRPDRHRRGHAREAIGLIEPYLHAVFGLRKLLLDVRSDNVDAISLYETVGFRHVGTMHEHHRVGHTFHDVHVMEKVFAG